MTKVAISYAKSTKKARRYSHRKLIFSAQPKTLLDCQLFHYSSALRPDPRCLLTHVS